MWCRDVRPAIAAMSGPLVFIFLLTKELSGKRFTKEAALYLIVSAGLLASGLFGRNGLMVCQPASGRVKRRRPSVKTSAQSSAKQPRSGRAFSDRNAPAAIALG